MTGVDWLTRTVKEAWEARGGDRLRYFRRRFLDGRWVEARRGGEGLRYAPLMLWVGSTCVASSESWMILDINLYQAL